MQSPTKKLSTLAEYLRNIEAINSGGCGFAALVLYNWIKEKYPSAKIDIVYLYSWESDSLHDNESILLQNDTERHPRAASHIVLMYKKILFDCTGVLYTYGDFFDKPVGLHDNYDNSYAVDNEDEDKYYWYHIANVEFLKKSLRKVSNWNDWFNRRTQVPKIKRDTGIPLTLKVA